MDLLFPLSALQQPSLYFVTILRYQPSFEPESQIIMIGREGYAEILEYRSLDGNLFYKLDDLLRNGNITAAEFAKQIHISRRTLRIPFSLAQVWRKKLIDSVAFASKPRRLHYVPFPKTITVVTDGTKYEVWDSSLGGVDLHFELVGGKTHKRVYPTWAPLISWIDAIKLDVGKR
jgi:hypothetical protein